MEISDIKSRLPIIQVLAHYNLDPDRNSRLLCPWHNDKTPSLQIYPKTNTWTCFSTNCQAGSGDVIDFILRMERCTKHEALLKAKAMIGHHIIDNVQSKLEASYEKLFQKFRQNFKSGQAVKYLDQRSLDRKKIEVGYNANTWPYLKHCLIFPLRDPSEQIVSFYGRSIYDKKESRHFYLKNRKGLYPTYPAEDTKKLILTESVIDAASLLQLELAYGVLAMYGTNGLTEEHQEVIKNLSSLEEVILFFDGDEAGRKAIEKWSPVLQQIKPGIHLSYISTPEGEDINSLSQSHEPTIFHHLLSERIQIKPENQTLLFSPEKSIEKSSDENKKDEDQATLNTSNPDNISYQGTEALYYIKGQIKGGLEMMKISLQILNDQGSDYRSRLDLYEYKQVGAVASIAAERLQLSQTAIENDLSQLAWHLEQYRQRSDKAQETTKVLVPEELAGKCLDFLRKPKLIKAINEWIGRAGITGEENNRIFLFVIASSYKMEDTLHALVQGSSGSGKTHLIIKISGFMPPEDVIGLTRITDSSLYNYGEYELSNKLVNLEDLDGLKEDAFLAYRELQSRGLLASSTSVKDDSGNIRSQIRTVRGPIASLAATTKGEVYEDNMSRCFLVAVDEGADQTMKIIAYQNGLSCGKIKRTEQKKIKQFLQNCIRLLKPYEVINPYADKIQLPKEAHKIRRLNELFQAFVKQVTLLNQYQRQKDNQGRLITDKEDIQTAIEIMFESIVLKVDELDGSLRQFFEQLKTHLKEPQQTFTQREIRQTLRISKTQLQRYIQDLIELEYVHQNGGHPNRGYTYKISYWDNIVRLRTRIQDDLYSQVDRL